MYSVFLENKNKKQRMALSTRLRTAGDTRSNNSLVRSKAQVKVPRLEIKNQTYEKLRQRHKKLKPFKCQGVWLLPLLPPPPPQPDGILVYCRVPPESFNPFTPKSEYSA